MYDYFFQWVDETAAKADAMMLADYLNVSPGDLRDWARDKVLPNVKVWRPSRDVTSGSPPVVTHTYLTGWYGIIALDRQVPVLLNATALAFCMNRDGPPYLIKNNIGAVITDIACEPIFTGSHYPIGGYT